MGKRGEFEGVSDLTDIEDLQYSTTGSRSETREAVSKNDTYPPAV